LFVGIPEIAGEASKLVLIKLDSEEEAPVRQMFIDKLAPLIDEVVQTAPPEEAEAARSHLMSILERGSEATMNTKTDVEAMRIDFFEALTRYKGMFQAKKEAAELPPELREQHMENARIRLDKSIEEVKKSLDS
jgi:hypothetical protein